MVNALFVKKIRRYEHMWREVFGKGENTSLVAKPQLTSEGLASVIRQCPLIQKNEKLRAFDGDWLLESLGRRFVYAESSAFRSELNVRLPHCFPPVIQACFDGDSEMLKSLLYKQKTSNSSRIDGCTMFPWLFMLEDLAAVAETLKSMFAESVAHHIDLPFLFLRKAHDQWPLQLRAETVPCIDDLTSYPSQIILESPCTKKQRKVKVDLLTICFHSCYSSYLILIFIQR